MNNATEVTEHSDKYLNLMFKNLNIYDPVTDD